MSSALLGQLKDALLDIQARRAELKSQFRGSSELPPEYHMRLARLDEEEKETAVKIVELEGPPMPTIPAQIAFIRTATTGLQSDFTSLRNELRSDATDLAASLTKWQEQEREMRLERQKHTDYQQLITRRWLAGLTLVVLLIAVVLVRFFL